MNENKYVPPVPQTPLVPHHETFPACVHAWKDFHYVTGQITFYLYCTRCAVVIAVNPSNYV